MILRKLRYKIQRFFSKPLISPSDTKLWEWFGLTYAPYLVLPRSIVCDMPIEWQNKFAELLEELDVTFKQLPITGTYSVIIKDCKGRRIEDPLQNYRHPDYQLIDSIRLKPRE